MSVMNQVSTSFKMTERNQMLAGFVSGGMCVAWIIAVTSGALAQRSVHIVAGLIAFGLISAHMILRHSANEALQGWKKTHTFALSATFKLMIVSGVIVALYDTPAIFHFHRVMVDVFGLLMIAHLWVNRQKIARYIARWRGR